MSAQRKYQRLVFEDIGGIGDFWRMEEHLVTTTHGMSGYFAVQMWINPDMGGFYEPYDSGIGRYKTEFQAAQEAVMWADELDVPCVLSRAMWEQLKQKGLIS